MPTGVTTKKKIINIISGEIIFPNKIPNLNHKILRGFKKTEFKIPKIKKISEIEKKPTFKIPP